MSDEYKVSRCSRRCHVEDRPLQEGEAYVSVLIDGADAYERRDYSAAAWSGPPDDTIGWWRSRMPTAGERKSERKSVPAPKAVLIDLLTQMSESPEQGKIGYLLALLLLRRRVMRVVPAAEAGLDRPDARPGCDEASSAGDPADAPPAMRLEVIGDGRVIDVPVCEIGAGEAAALTEQLNALIYCDADEMPDEGVSAGPPNFV